MNKRPFLVLLLSFLVFITSVFVGPDFINPFKLSPLDKRIILQIRLPRIVVSLLMGSALGASGAVLQAFLRNPLADPYILGLSGGAALMATIAILAGSLSFGLFTVPLFAFCGAIATGIMVGFLTYKRGNMLPERMILAGVALGFLFSAVIMLILSISSDEGLRKAIHWIFGDLSMVDWSLVPHGAVVIALGLALAVARTKALNALVLGDELAHSLGFSPFRERLILFVSVCLMTASSVSLGGIVGFVGLLVPHIVRFTVGADSRKLVPLSAVSGAALLCLADTIARTAASPIELPTGIVTAIIGSPYFLYLLRKKEVLTG